MTLYTIDDNGDHDDVFSHFGLHKRDGRQMELPPHVCRALH